MGQNTLAFTSQGFTESTLNCWDANFNQTTQFLELAARGFPYMGTKITNLYKFGMVGLGSGGVGLESDGVGWGRMG